MDNSIRNINIGQSFNAYEHIIPNQNLLYSSNLILNNGTYVSNTEEITLEEGSASTR